MTRNFDAESSAVQAQITALKTQMQKIQERFIAAAGKALGAWFQSSTDQYVKSGVDNTIKLGAERLKEFKKAVAELQGRATAIAAECLGHDHMWWHSSKYPTHWTSTRSSVNRALSESIAQWVSMLGAYGYEQPGKVFVKRSYAPNSSDHQAEDVRWSPEMNAIFKEYMEAYERALHLVTEDESVVLAKRAEEAANLWKNA